LYQQNWLKNNFALTNFSVLLHCGNKTQAFQHSLLLGVVLMLFIMSKQHQRCQFKILVKKQIVLKRGP